MGFAQPFMDGIRHGNGRVVSNGIEHQDIIIVVGIFFEALHRDTTNEAIINREGQVDKRFRLAADHWFFNHANVVF